MFNLMVQKLILTIKIVSIHNAIFENLSKVFQIFVFKGNEEKIGVIYIHRRKTDNHFSNHLKYADFTNLISKILKNVNEY